MLTPQEIDGITLDTAVFGGYDTKSVDAFLEPLIADYGTLYKENALLKSKMRILVGKMEEYRANESSMKDAMVNAQKTCDKMVREAEEKCAQMLSDASDSAADARSSSQAAQIAELQQRNEAAMAQIAQIQEQLSACIEALEQVRADNGYSSATGSKVSKDPADDVAAEIAANLRNLMDGDTPAKGDARMSNFDTTSKFSNLQFGRNYDAANR